MHNRNNLSRITIDITKDQHKKLKAKAAILGKSMRELVIEAIEAYGTCSYEHSPNQKTLKTLQNIEERKNLVEVDDIQDFFNKMGF